LALLVASLGPLQGRHPGGRPGILGVQLDSLLPLAGSAIAALPA